MDRHGARPLFIVSLLVMGVSFLLRPLMAQLWHWYALSFLQFVFSPGVSPLPIGRLVAIWFPGARGRVMGMTVMGNNFGGATLPIITWLAIVNASWEAAYVVYAAIAGSIALLGMALVYERGRGGGDMEAQGGTGPSDAVLTGWTVSEALRTPAFYAITVATTLAMFTYSGVLPWVGSHLANEGMPVELAARAMTLLALAGMTGKVVFGSLADLITARRAMMLSLAGQVAFILLMVAYPTPPPDMAVRPAVRPLHGRIRSAGNADRAGGVRGQVLRQHIRADQHAVGHFAGGGAAHRRSVIRPVAGLRPRLPHRSGHVRDGDWRPGAGQAGSQAVAVPDRIRGDRGR